MVFVILWTIIFAFLAIYLGKSPRVRSWLKLIFKAPRVWRTIVGSVALVATIIITYLIVPKSAATNIDERILFEDYAATAVMKLDSMQALKVDIDCNMQHPEPELVYVLPLILGAYNEIVDKPTMPIVMRLDDTLHLAMNGYKQFKNRGIRLNKLLQKKLGKRYKTKITSEGSSHTLIITYVGEPWDTEQLLQVGVSQENAVATFYPDPEINSKPENWSKSPLTKSWVDQVLSDMEFYHSNGLSHFVR